MPRPSRLWPCSPLLALALWACSSSSEDTSSIRSGGGASGASGGPAGASGAGAAGVGGASSAGAGQSSGGSAGQSGAGECKLVAAGPTGCKMELVGWSELPAPSDKAAQVGGPAVVATGEGFVVAYHEMTADGSRRRVALSALGLDGCRGVQDESSQLTDECTGAPFAPELGAAWSAGLKKGLLAAGRQPCPAQNRGGGVALVSFDAKGKVLNVGSIDRLGEPTFPLPKLSGPRSVIEGSGGDEFVVAYSQHDETASLGIQGAGPTSVEGDIVSGGPEHLGSPLFAVGERAGARRVTAAAGTLPDSSSATLLKQVVGGSAVVTKRPFARLMTLRAYGDRVVTFGRSDASDQLGWSILASDGSQLFPDPAAKPDANEPLAIGSPTAGFDVALVNDRLILAVGQPSGLQLAWFAGASASPTPAAGSPLVLDGTNLPPLAAFDGKQLAVAADSDRVAVAWINRLTGGGSSVGGVAVFKCE